MKGMPKMKKYSGRTATAIIEFPPQMILLIKRDTVPFKGYWALPGGRAEPSEAVEQTIVREVKEETGLDVAVVRKIGEYHELVGDIAAHDSRIRVDDFELEA